MIITSCHTLVPAWALTRCVAQHEKDNNATTISFAGLVNPAIFITRCSTWSRMCRWTSQSGNRALERDLITISLYRVKEKWHGLQTRPRSYNTIRWSSQLTVTFSCCSVVLCLSVFGLVFIDQDSWSWSQTLLQAGCMWLPLAAPIVIWSRLDRAVVFPDSVVLSPTHSSWYLIC